MVYPFVGLSGVQGDPIHTDTSVAYTSVAYITVTYTSVTFHCKGIIDLHIVTVVSHTLPLALRKLALFTTESVLLLFCNVFPPFFLPDPLFLVPLVETTRAKFCLLDTRVMFPLPPPVTSTHTHTSTLHIHMHIHVHIHIQIHMIHIHSRIYIGLALLS